MTAIRLIVGLGNPGLRYADTRHNVGARYLEHLAERQGLDLAEQPKFKAWMARGGLAGEELRLMIPTTYMNLSGQAVGAVARYFKLEPAQILVAYDDMAFEPGIVRLRRGGGANGHKGLLDIISALANDPGFLRLRIGVGHPGDAGRVTAYLTSERMPEAEWRLVQGRFTDIDELLPLILRGEENKAMNLLHAPAPEGGSQAPQGER